MSIHRRAAKRDKNEAEIVVALRAIGATVAPVSGAGVADLVVGYRGVNFLLEVKGKRGKLTDDQVKFSQTWQGQYAVARTVDEALRAIGAID